MIQYNYRCKCNFTWTGDQDARVCPSCEATVPESNSSFWVSTDGPIVDVVNHPPHYTSHPSGVECIQVTEHMGFNLGNAIKYIWRADMKGGEQDLQKAAWYINREIQRRSKTQGGEN